MAATISGNRRSFLVKKPLNADKSPGPIKTTPEAKTGGPYQLNTTTWRGESWPIRAPCADIHTDN
jgi:hypothetical protein